MSHIAYIFDIQMLKVDKYVLNIFFTFKIDSENILMIYFTNI